MLSLERLLLSLALSLPLAACSSAPSQGTGGGGSGTGTGGSGTGTGGSGGTGGSEPACPPGSHAGSGGCEATLEGWSETAPLIKARDHHVTFASVTPAGAFLYVACGTNGSSVMSDVERAPIGADGTLGAFAASGKLPKGLIGPGLAQIDRALVIGGGLDGQKSLGDTFVGAVADDGSLSFTAGPPLGTTRYHVSLSVHGGFVYAAGGMQQEIVNGAPKQTLLDGIERASFDGTTLGAFEAIEPLPGPLTHHAALVHGDALYVVGGISSFDAKTEIWRAPFQADGHLGAWEQAGTLPTGRATSSAFVFLDRLYVIAGATAAQGNEVATVLRAPLDAAGKVGSFEELAPLPLARAHSHQTPLHQGFLYSAGGSVNHAAQKQVFLGTLQ